MTSYELLKFFYDMSYGWVDRIQTSVSISIVAAYVNYDFHTFVRLESDKLIRRCSSFSPDYELTFKGLWALHLHRKGLYGI
jgi:hypothetical protein